MSQAQSSHYGALVIRTSFGTILVAHGLLKLLVFTMAGTVAYFESLGLPALVAYLTVFGEIAGGVAIIVGLYTRLAALLSLPILFGALWAHSTNAWVFSSEGGGWEFPLLLVVMAIAVALHGNGAYAIRKLAFVDTFIPQPLKG